MATGVSEGLEAATEGVGLAFTVELAVAVGVGSSTLAVFEHPASTATSKGRAIRNFFKGLLSLC